MPDLRDLAKAIADAATARRTGRIYFYIESEPGQAMRFGHVLIDAEGAGRVYFGDKCNEDALRLVASLPAFLKIVFMPAATPASPEPAIPLRVLLAWLSTADPGDGAGAAASTSGSPDARAAQEPLFEAHDMLAPEAAAELVTQAVALISQFYGSAAKKKCEEAAARYPPQRQPGQFLDACRAHLVMMVGPDKASRAFEPLYARILP